MEALLTDLRYALRTLARSPGFTAVAVLTLALGIGASTTVFSVVERLLLNPLPYPSADRLVSVWMHDPSTGIGIGPAVRDARWRQSRTLDAVELVSSHSWSLEGDGEPQIVNGAAITPSLLVTLGVRPIVGRPLVATDTLPDAPRVVLLDERFWRSRFGGRPDILGRSIRLDSVLYTVVGVAPERLTAIEGWRPNDLWIPWEPGRHEQSAVVVARLRAGVSRLEAQRELQAFVLQERSEHAVSEFERRLVVALYPVGVLRAGNTRRAVLVLAGAVGLLLLIACANVANLLLVRAAGREREIAMRMALGASRTRLLRQVLTESVVLSILGAAAGLIMVEWTMTVLAGFHPRFLYQLEHLTLDSAVLWFSTLTSIGTGLLFGLLPAIRATEVRLHDALKGPAVTGATSARLQSSLVAAELALTTALLLAGGVLIRSLVAEQNADPGFRPNGLVGVEVQLPAYRYTTDAARIPFWQAVLARARGLPVASRVILTSSPLPNPGPLIGTTFDVEGEPRDSQEQSTPIALDIVPPDYFATLDIPILEGRSFTADEHRTGSPVAVINESMARRLGAGTSVLGKRFRISPRDSWRTVVGVIRDDPQTVPAPLGKAPYQVRMPFPELGGVTRRGGWLIARASPPGNPAVLLTALRGVVRSVDSAAVLETAAGIPTLLAAQLADARFTATLLGVFAGLALVLAVVGLFGVVSYEVAQRTRELGIRIALGAPPGGVVGLVVRQGLVATTVGLVAGAVLGVSASGVLRPLLYKTPPADPLTSLSVAGVLCLGALLGCYLPARRATKVDPMVALRYD